MVLVPGQVLEKVVRRELKGDRRYDSIADDVAEALRAAAGQLNLVETGTSAERGEAVSALMDLVGQPAFDVPDVLAAAVRNGCRRRRPTGIAESEAADVEARLVAAVVGFDRRIVALSGAT